MDIREGDSLLLCTDGLNAMVHDSQIAQILRDEDDPRCACQALVDAANRAGGRDNISVIVIDVDAV